MKFNFDRPVGEWVKSGVVCGAVMNQDVATQTDLCSFSRTQDLVESKITNKMFWGENHSQGPIICE